MANLHKILRLDVMSGNCDNSQVKSAKYFKGGAAADVDNATIVGIKELIEGERELFKVEDVTDADVLVGIVSTPEVMYDQRGIGDDDLANFYNLANDAVRVHVAHEGDTFSIANADDATELAMGAKLVGKRIQTEVVGRYTYQVYSVQAKA